ncbi:MAG: LysR family transcriptional regulator [Coprococcus sp.]
MDIKDLKVFQAIAKEESITKASRILYMTPQGISKIVKNLEAEMGCRLFTRNKAGMLLTESGKRFLEYADKDIADYYQVKKRYPAYRAETEESGRCCCLLMESSVW